jgi:hypothetical protein
MDEKLSRRKVLSSSLLGAAFGLLAPTVLATSDVQAHTPPPTSAAPTPTAETGPERRQKRRAARQERRQERRAAGQERRHERRSAWQERREERREGGHENYLRERHDPTPTN